MVVVLAMCAVFGRAGGAARPGQRPTAPAHRLIKEVLALVEARRRDAVHLQEVPVEAEAALPLATLPPKVAAVAGVAVAATQATAAGSLT